MKFMETRRYEMLVRVRDFGAANGDRFPASTLAGKTFAGVSSTVNDLAGLAGTQLAAQGNADASVNAKAAARVALREDLDKIRRTAHIIANDIPDLERKFQIPKPGTDQVLIAAGRAFAQYAAPFAETFIGHELPPDFIDQLKKHVDEFERAIGDFDKWQNTYAAATQNIQRAMAKGASAARRLDIMVRNKTQGDDAMLAAWDRTFRLFRIRRGKPAPSTANPVTPPSPPASAPAPAHAASQ